MSSNDPRYSLRGIKFGPMHCEICGKNRSTGNRKKVHLKCSKIKQAHYQEKQAELLAEQLYSKIEKLRK